jgi:hypothetical protein
MSESTVSTNDLLSTNYGFEGNVPSNFIFGDGGSEVIRFTFDKGFKDVKVTVNPQYTLDEAAKAVLVALEKLSAITNVQLKDSSGEVLAETPAASGECNSCNYRASVKELEAKIANLEDSQYMLLKLLADIRVAVGDDGLRMWPELIEYCRTLRATVESSWNKLDGLNYDYLTKEPTLIGGPNTTLDHLQSEAVKSSEKLGDKPIEEITKEITTNNANDEFAPIPERWHKETLRDIEGRNIREAKRNLD